MIMKSILFKGKLLVTRGKTGENRAEEMGLGPLSGDLVLPVMTFASTEQGSHAKKGSS